MKEFTFIIPVTGNVTTKIVSDSYEEAFDILMDKKEQLETIPYGKLDLELDSIIVIDRDLKMLN